MRHISGLLVLMMGCSDYNFKGNVDPATGTVDTGTGPVVETTDGGSTDDSTCDDQTLPADVLALNDECFVEYTVGTFTPVVEWTKSSWTVDPTSNNIMMTPIVVSLTDDNGDGLIDDQDVPDIVVVTYGSQGTLRAVSGDGSGEIFNVTGQSLQITGAIAAGDIDGDGLVEIIACTSNQVKAFENDGRLKWTSPSLAGHMYGTSDAPAIADMDGDGSPEIMVGNAILNADGSLRGLGSYGMGGVTGNVGTTSFAADIDADGTLELITGNAVYRPDGTAIWHNGGPDGYVAVGDFDGDGLGEIVTMNSGTVRLLDTDGSVIWTATVTSPNAGYGGPPTVADFDGDGLPEIGVAARSNYTVFDTDGTRLWERSTTDASSGNTGSSVFDFEGDGVAEVVYADETRLWVFNGPDGAVKLESTEHSNGTWTEYPVIADVDGDGQAEIVVPNTTTYTGITVFGDRDGSWKSGRRIWNQHAYSITNVNDDGTIPTYPDRNWDTYNNFRSGDLTAGQNGEYPDLVVKISDVCTRDCDDDLLVVWVQVGNQGYLGVEDNVDLVVFGLTSDGGKEELYRDSLVDLIDAGVLLPSVQIVIDLSAYPGVVFDDLFATIDGGNSSTTGVVDECDETNNEDRWGENLCVE
ncbi:MAG: VCBS repeat-containing protein [Oligoflexia bacterium]|nr:VCBS repeat-containing protein [Oligoflexia bacterium]